jgi:hypothetical protein
MKKFNKYLRIYLDDYERFENKSYFLDVIAFTRSSSPFLYMKTNNEWSFISNAAKRKVDLFYSEKFNA